MTDARPSTPPRHLLPWFIAAFFLLNLLQAAVLGVDADEAYYWLYSQNLSWGYFDHPPMVALLIRLGETFGHGPLFTRLATVLLSAATAYLTYQLLPLRQRNQCTYLLAFASVVLFHLYGFITTPDSGLLFFTALFFYRYKKYLEKDSILNVLWLAVSMAGLLYSKYHGVLPVFFVFLSNPRLALRPTAWLAVGLVAAAFLPHLWWQYAHNWPTVRYHLLERTSGNWQLEKTALYLLIQLIIWGPFTTIPFYYLLFKTRLRFDAYLRAHLFNVAGVFLFFLLMSFRITVQGHWVLAAGPSMVVLLHQTVINAPPRIQRLFRWGMGINIALILLLRAALFFPGLPLQNVSGLTAAVYGRAWAGSVYNRAAGQPVVFANSYAWPALYRYYHPAERAIGYNTIDYRKSQFSLTQTDTAFQGQDVFLADPDSLNSGAVFIESPYINLYLNPFSRFQAVTPLQVAWNNPAKKMAADRPVQTTITFTNTGNDTLRTQNLFLGSVFLRTRQKKSVSPQTLPFSDAVLPPGYTKSIMVNLYPPAQTGDWFVIYTIVQPPLSGSFASDFYKVRVE